MSLVSITNMQCPIGMHHKHGPIPVLENDTEKLSCQLCTVNPLNPFSLVPLNVMVFIPLFINIISMIILIQLNNRKLLRVYYS